MLRSEVVYSALLLRNGYPPKDVVQYSKLVCTELFSFSSKLRKNGIAVPPIQKVPNGVFCSDLKNFIGRVYYTGVKEADLIKILASSMEENFDLTTKLFDIVGLRINSLMS
ncbi:MAG: hypothetical protein ABIB79_05160 [archaeon]